MLIFEEKPRPVAVSRLTPAARIQDSTDVGAPTLQEAPTYDFAKVFQKLHEIEKNWTGGGGGVQNFTM